MTSTAYNNSTSKPVLCYKSILFLGDALKKEAKLITYFKSQKKSCYKVTSQHELDFITSQVQPDVVFIHISSLNNSSFQCEMSSHVFKETVFILLSDEKNRSQDLNLYYSKGWQHILMLEHLDYEFLNCIISASYLKKKEANNRSSIENNLAQVEALNLELQKKTAFIKSLSQNLQSPLDQLSQLTHIAIQRHSRKQWSQLGEYLGEIKMISEELMIDVNDLREMALLKTGESKFNIENVEIEELLRSIFRQFKPIAESKGASLVTEINLNFNFVQADYSQLLKVINILMRNAFRQLKTKGTLKIKAYNVDQFFELSITNAYTKNNLELENAHINKIQQESLIEKRKHLGFCLAVCKELMTGQKGDIKIVNNPHCEESQIIISLPVSKSFLD